VSGGRSLLEIFSFFVFIKITSFEIFEANSSRLGSGTLKIYRGPGIAVFFFKRAVPIKVPRSRYFQNSFFIYDYRRGVEEMVALLVSFFSISL
jgi:hypothetical protein